MKNLIVAAGFLVMSMGMASAQVLPGAHFIENWDLNADGKVTLEEATERRGDLFVMFDTDENNELNAEEYALFDQTREEDMAQNVVGHGNGGMMGAQSGLMMDFNDVNLDGVVTKDEFVGKVPEWLTMMDRNGDGEVTADDFGRGK